LKKKVLFPIIAVFILLICIIYIQNSKKAHTASLEQTNSTAESSESLESSETISSSYYNENTSVVSSSYAETEASSSVDTSTEAVQAKRIICIDPGHQAEQNLEREQRAPGSEKTNVKVAGGAFSSVFRAEEYDITLGVGLKLRDLLLEDGYEVYMTREVNEVNISNRQRVELANSVNADAAILIHVDGYDDTSVNGFSLLVPTKDYVSEEIYNQSHVLADSLKEVYKEYTQARLRGIYERNDLVALNWAKIPIVLVETGFLSNLDEGAKLISDEYQMTIAQALRDGLNAYFEDMQTDNSALENSNK